MFSQLRPGTVNCVILVGPNEPFVFNGGVSETGHRAFAFIINEQKTYMYVLYLQASHSAKLKALGCA